ncbi:MAG: hypothetical protein HYX94_08425 [Chloroflexi bacterium]|nr:hypothetical protein [Chloroflexota bacterium]
MQQPTDEFRDLARRFLVHEAKGVESPSVGVLADAAERACQKIHQQVADLIGPAGVNALMARALHLAKVDPSLEKGALDGVEVAIPSHKDGACLKGLHESVKGRDPAGVSRSLTALLANFIFLLGTFVGQDIAQRQMAQIWPDVQVGGTGPASTEVKD